MSYPFKKTPPIFGESMDEFLDQLQEELYGPTPRGCCIKCKEPFTSKNVHTAAGWLEIDMSKLCENCFDEVFSD